MKLTLLILISFIAAVPLFPQTPHPILRYLTINLIEDEIRLNWVITGGNTCSGIRIQRSDDGQFFETIGEIDGVCGSPDVDVPYVFMDTNPLPNQRNYYRLELGTQGYSSPVSIQYVPLNNKGFALTYDVISRTATIHFNNEDQDKVSYDLISTSGRLVYESTTNRSWITVNLSPYAPQIYLLRIYVNNRVIPVKVPGF